MSTIAMIASVTITFSVPVVEKHQRQMRLAAESLTDSKSSVQISQRDGDPKKLNACFSIPKARQAEVVDHIGRRFWHFIEDYADSAIGFGPGSRRTRRRRRESPTTTEAKVVTLMADSGLKHLSTDV